MTRTLRLKDLESAAANNSAQPFFTTGSDGRNGVRPSIPVPPPKVGVLFEEHWNDQPDYTMDMYEPSGTSTHEVSKGDILPDNWDKLFANARWTPEKGYPNNHPSLEILAANSDKARGGTGKSAVFWRESYGSSWNSDAQLIKVMDNYYHELYVEFWIRFSPNWWQRNPTDDIGWHSKIFRIGSYSGSGEIWNGAGGQVGPRYFWGYKRDQYGIRNMVRLLKGPHGDSGEVPTGRDGSKNYTNHTLGNGINGSDPEVPDLINGGFLKDATGIVEHEQIFGPTQVWTKLGFYVKINSGPGEPDGILRQWINGVQYWNDTGITWYDETALPEQMVGWNYFGIGGNDFFGAVPREELFEDWWSLDDLVVRDSIPEELQ